MSGEGGILSQVWEGPPFHVWGHTLCQVRGVSISGLGWSPISCLGVHLMSGEGGILYQVWDGLPFHVWGCTLSQVRGIPYIRSGEGSPFHVWGCILCQVRGYPISGLGWSSISCLGAHPMSSEEGILSQV